MLSREDFYMIKQMRQQGAYIVDMGYTGGRSMLRYYIQPKRKMRPSKRTVRFETQPGYQLQHD